MNCRWSATGKRKRIECSNIGGFCVGALMLDHPFVTVNGNILGGCAFFKGVATFSWNLWDHT